MGVLEKRAPVNPKYKQVMGKLNTGLTVDKLKNMKLQKPVHFGLILQVIVLK
jgi:hypothetical protein